MNRIRITIGVIASVIVAAFLLYLTRDGVAPPPPPPPSEKQEPETEPPRRIAERAWARGNAALDRQAFDEAMAAYEEALATDASFGLAYLSRGNTRLARQEYDAAVSDYAAAIEREPDLAEAYLARGMARWLQGQLTEAADDFRQLTIMRPNNAFFARRYAAVLYELERGEEADAFFREAYRADPTRTWALETSFQTLAQRGQWSDLLNEARHLYHTGSGGLPVRTALGQANFGLGNYDDAIEWLAPIAAESATAVPTDVILMLAAAYARTGQLEACRGALENYWTRMGRRHEYDPTQCGSETSS